MENILNEAELQKAKEKDMKKIDILKQKGFKHYTYDGNTGKLKEDNKLRPYNCKNLSGYFETDGGYFAQTNKGKELATKLVLREMRKDIKADREHIKTLKGSVEKLKKSLPNK